MWPPWYWWMRWWLAKYWSGIAGSPVVAVLAFQRANQMLSGWWKVADRLGVDDQRLHGVRAGVEAGDVAAGVQPDGPLVEEGAGGCQAGGVGVGERLHVEVDRVADAQAERVELGDGVVGRRDALGGGLRRVDPLGDGDLGEAGRLQPDVRGDQGPALRDGLGHPVGGQVGLGAAAAGAADVHVGRLVRRGREPGRPSSTPAAPCRRRTRDRCRWCPTGSPPPRQRRSTCWWRCGLAGRARDGGEGRGRPTCPTER